MLLERLRKSITEMDMQGLGVVCNVQRNRLVKKAREGKKPRKVAKPATQRSRKVKTAAQIRAEIVEAIKKLPPEKRAEAIAKYIGGTQ